MTILFTAKDAVWGSIMRAFGSDEAGKRAGEAACRAIGALANVGQIDTMITNFLVPLQVLMSHYSSRPSHSPLFYTRPWQIPKAAFTVL